MKQILGRASGAVGVVVILLTVLQGCAPAERSNLGVERLSGRTLEGEPIRFANLQTEGLVLNFYSPTCKPCIEELPALDHFSEEARKRGMALFIVVEPDLEKNGVGTGNGPVPDEGTVFRLLGQRLRQDITKYRIRIPVVILDRPFTIQPGGLVTGTPETLLFQTNPLRLTYNFIGPLSTSADEAHLAMSPRYRFAVMKLNEMAQAGPGN